MGTTPDKQHNIHTHMQAHKPHAHTDTNTHKIMMNKNLKAVFNANENNTKTHLVMHI